jgi:hypothetical protein
MTDPKPPDRPALRPGEALFIRYDRRRPPTARDFAEIERFKEFLRAHGKASPRLLEILESEKNPSHEEAPDA